MAGRDSRKNWTLSRRNTGNGVHAFTYRRGCNKLRDYDAAHQNMDLRLQSRPATLCRQNRKKTGRQPQGRRQDSDSDISRRAICACPGYEGAQARITQRGDSLIQSINESNFYSSCAAALRAASMRAWACFQAKRADAMSIERAGLMISSFACRRSFSAFLTSISAPFSAMSVRMRT